MTNEAKRKAKAARLDFADGKIDRDSGGELNDQKMETTGGSDGHLPNAESGARAAVL